MKLRDMVGSLVGGGVVYVAMAACSAGAVGPSGATGSATGTSSLVGAGGMSGSSGATGMGGLPQTGQGGGTGMGGDDGGIWDALMDPVPEAAADPTSGSRLKAKYRVADDGSKAYLPYEWFDSERNETCFFGVAADGKERCLPGGHHATSGFFTDPACSMPIAYTFAGCQPDYVVVGEPNPPNACIFNVAVTHLHNLGPAINPATVYSKSGNSCSGGPPSPQFIYFGIGAEIPASSFVASSVLHD